MEIIFNILFGLGMYMFGKYEARRDLIASHIKSSIDSANIPIVVAEQTEGYYYLYEKDTTNFLCQSETIEDIPNNLYNSNRISLALILFPEQANDAKFWCINGKIRLAE